MQLDPAFRQRISTVFGDAGAVWLKALPALLAEFAERWALTLGEPFELSYNFVVAATRAGEAMVLKAGVPNPERYSEIAALQLFAGAGAARVLEADAKRGVMLLERVDPGTVLSDFWPVRDDEATRIAASIMRALWRPLPEDHPFPTLERWSLALERIARDHARAQHLDKQLLHRALGLRRELLNSAPQTVLLHGDLHHLNILSSKRAGWLLIDPKGLAGERAYDCVSFLLNPEGLYQARQRIGAVIARRVEILSDLLSLDRVRVIRWTFVHSVLSACWSAEDGEDGSDALEIAKIIECDHRALL